jgi:predicted nucleotidyltransferase
MLLADEIILTLFQASLFEYPLTREQARARLLKKCSERDFLAEIEALKRQKLICEHNGYLSLVYRDIDICSFKQRQKISRQKREQIKPLLRFLQRFPLVSAVALTGSMAINNARADDDIDFLIVTAPKSLYVVRAAVTILSIFCGHKRTKKIGAAQKDQWCFNMWLTENNLCVPRARQTLYSAYELLQADFVIDKNEVRKKMWRENKKWLEKHLPNAR